MPSLFDNESILMSMKKLLNVAPEDMSFDTDIGMFINSEFMTLHQLGIGPKDGFSITGAHETWTDFSTNKKLIEAVKEFVYLKVRMVFDVPGSSVVADAYRQRIAEVEWRLNVMAEEGYSDSSGGDTPAPPTPPPGPVPTEINFDVDQDDEELIIHKDPIVPPVSPTLPPKPPKPPVTVNLGTEKPADSGSGNTQNGDPQYQVVGENLQIFGNLFGF